LVTAIKKIIHGHANGSICAISDDNEAEMIYLLAIVLVLVLVAWLDRIARAQEVAALTLIYCTLF
jgi:hypothetical protein